MIDFLTLFVSLGLVSFILLAYTQLDKKRHKLDKIRRYVDKTRQDLEGFIEERTHEISDLAIDLEAYQRSGAEILKKLQEFYQEIEQKETKVNLIEEKIRDYESSLSQLNMLSRSVQENLLRIQGESSFIDKLDKRLKKSQDQIENLESSFLIIREDFALENKKSLDDVKTRLEISFEEKSQDLFNEVKSSKAFLESYKTSFEEIGLQKESILRNLNDRINETLRQSISQMEMRLEGYEGKLEKGYVDYQKKWSDLQRIYETQIDFTLKEVNALTDKVLGESTYLIEEKVKDQSLKIEEKLLNSLSEVEKRQSMHIENLFDDLKNKLQLLESTQENLLSSLKDKVKTQVEESQKEIDSQVEFFSQRLNESEKILEDRVSTVKELSQQEKESIQKQIQSQYSQISETVNNQIKDLSYKVKDEVESLEFLLNGESQEIRKLVSESKADFESWRKDLDSEWQEIAAYVQGVERSVKDALALESGKGKKIAEDLFQQLEEYFQEKGVEIHQRWYNRSLEVEKSCEDYVLRAEYLIKNSHQKVDSIEENISHKCEQLKGVIEEVAEKFDSQIATLNSSQKGSLNELIQNFEFSFSDRLKNVKQTLLKESQKFESWIEGLETQIKEKVSLEENDLLQYQEQVKIKIASFKEDFVSEFSNWQDELNSTQGAFLNKLKESQEEILKTESNLDGRMEEFQSNWQNWGDSLFNKLEELRNQSENYGRELFNEVSKNFQKKIEDLDLTLSSKFNKAVDQSNQLVGDLTTIFSSQKTEVDSFAMEWQSNLDSMRDKFENLRIDWNESYSEVIAQGRSLGEQLSQKLLQDINDAFKSSESEVLSRFERSQRATESRIEDLEQLFSGLGEQVVDFEEKLQEEFKNTQAHLKNEICDWGDSLKSQQAQIEDELKQSEKDIQEKLSLWDNSFNDHKEKMHQDVSQVERELALKIQEWKENLSRSQNLLEEELEKSENKTRDQVKVWQDELESNHSKTISQQMELKENFFDLKDAWQKQASLIEQDFNYRLKELDAFYQEQVKSLQVSIAGRYDVVLEEIEGQTSEAKENVLALLASQEKEIESHLEQVQKKLEKVSYISNNVSEEAENLQNSLMREVKDLNNQIETFSKDMQLKFAQISENVHMGVVSDVDQKIEEFDKGIRYRFERLHALEEDMISLELGLKGSLDDISQKISVSLGVQEKDLLGRLEKQSHHYLQILGDNEGHVEVLKTDITRLSEDLENLKTKSYNNVSSHLKVFEDEFFSDIKDRRERLDQTLLTWQKSIEDACNERLKNDIGSLEGSINKKTKDLEAAYIENLQKEIQQVKNQSGQYFEQLQKGILDFEEDLQNRLSQSKDRLEVSQKEVEARQIELEQVQKVLHDQLVHSSEEGQRLLDNLINHSRDKINQQLRFIEDKMMGRLNDFGSVIDVKQRGLDDWIFSFKQDMSHWQEEVFAKIKEDTETLKLDNKTLSFQIQEKSGAFNDFKKDMDQVSNSLNERLNYQFDESSKELEKRINLLKSRLENVGRSIEEDQDQLRDKIKQELNLFSHEVEDSLQIRQKDLENQLSQASLSLNDHVNAMFESYKKKYETSLEQGSGNLDKLKDEMLLLMKEIGIVKDTFERKVSQAKELIDSDYESVRSEMSQKVERLHAEVESRLGKSEEKINQFDTTFEEYQTLIRDRLKESYESLSGRIEDDWNSLTSQVNEKSKQVESILSEKLDYVQGIEAEWEDRVKKNYQKLFVEIQNVRSFHRELDDMAPIGEKVKNLRSEFETSMKGFKDNISLVYEQKESINEILQNSQQAKEFSKDLMTSFSQVMNEKNNLDFLRRDIERVVEVSRDIEERLERVGDHYQSLDEIQRKILQLSDLDAKLDNRFNELEVRNNTLEQTMAGLTKSYDLAKELEIKVTDLTQDMEKLPEEVKSLKEHYAALASHEDSAQKTVEMVERISDLILSLEERSEKAQNSLKWLASAETRLENLSRESKEQIRLLGLLMKDESRLIKKDQVPSENIRHNVMKLARQGWSKEEIARATKLSLGEVELIMELGIMPVEE